jgi:cell division protein FtsB
MSWSDNILNSVHEAKRDYIELRDRYDAQVRVFDKLLEVLELSGNTPDDAVVDAVQVLKDRVAELEKENDELDRNWNNLKDGQISRERDALALRIRDIQKILDR